MNQLLLHVSDDMRDEDIIAVAKSDKPLKPIFAKRMDWRNYPSLIKRTQIPMPDIPALPPLQPLPSITDKPTKPTSLSSTNVPNYPADNLPDEPHRLPSIELDDPDAHIHPLGDLTPSFLHKDKQKYLNSNGHKTQKDKLSGIIWEKKRTPQLNLMRDANPGEIN
jgi:hypothetical protein